MTTLELERRYNAATVELRADDQQKRLGGYAFKYNKLSRDLGGFVEQVAPGAVRKSLADKLDVLARYQHEDRFILGRTSSETLRLKDDKVGLDYEVDLPDASYARDLAALAERKDVRHSSFAFRRTKDMWSLSEKGYPVRTLVEFELLDVAPVVNPAYLDTTSALRSFAEYFQLDSEDAAKRSLDTGDARDLIERVNDPSHSGRQTSDPDARNFQQDDTHWMNARAERQALLRQKSRTP